MQAKMVLSATFLAAACLLSICSAAPSESLEQIIDRLLSGVKPTYGDGYELEQRRGVIDRLGARPDRHRGRAFVVR